MSDSSSKRERSKPGSFDCHKNMKNRIFFGRSNNNNTANVSIGNKFIKKNGANSLKTMKSNLLSINLSQSNSKKWIFLHYNDISPFRLSSHHF